MKTDYAFILALNYSQSHWDLSGDEYDGLVWKDEFISKPSKEDLDAEYIDYKKNHGYLRERKSLYFNKGITQEKMIIDLWEYVIEGKKEMAEKTQLQREEIKKALPKPEGNK